MYEQVQQQPPASVHSYDIPGVIFYLEHCSTYGLISTSDMVDHREVRNHGVGAGNEAYYEAGCKAHAQTCFHSLCEWLRKPNLQRAYRPLVGLQGFHRYSAGEFNQSIQEDQNERSKDSLPTHEVGSCQRLRWGISSRVLPIISDIYNNTASRDSQGWHAMLPTVVGVAIVDSSSLHTVLACSIQSLRFWKISPTLSPD